MAESDEWLLDQEPPPGYVREWTDRVAVDVGVHDAAAGDAFVFRLGLEWLALPVSLLQEVVEPGEIHKVPHRTGGLLLGLTNIRGTLLVCIALENLFDPDGRSGRGGRRIKSDVRTGDGRPRMLVLAHNGHRVVVFVDEVQGLLRYSAGQLQATPATVELASRVYTTQMIGWKNKTIGLLDGELLFYSIHRSLNWIQGGPRI